MKLYKKLFFLLSLISLFALTACGGETAPSSVESAAEGESSLKEAPDFTVYDRSGKAYSLSDFRGKGVILNFWASWCGPCKNEMPDFDEIYKELGDKYHFLMVNMTDGNTETVETAGSFIEEKGYSFPVYYDTEGTAGAAYSVYSIPTTYFIDAEGHVLAYASGSISGETLRSGISQFLDTDK